MAKSTNSTIEKRIAENKRKFLESMRATMCVISRSCEAVGIDRQTYYNWLENDADFARAVEECQEREIDFAESSLKKNIKDGDTTAIIFYLKTKGRKRGYNDKIEYSGSLDIQGNLKLEYNGMDAEQLSKEIDRLDNLNE